MGRRLNRGVLAGALALGIGLTGAASASAAGLDDTFGIDGVASTPLSGASSDRYLATARAPGGGTYNVGYTTVSGNDRAFVISRVDANGELVDSFGTGGVAVVNVVTGPFDPAPNAPSGAPQTAPNGSAELARGVVVQPDGKIVISGQAETPPGGGQPDSRDLDIYVVRLTAAGTPDGTFGTGGTTRIDLSDGVTPPSSPSATSTSVNTDQSYGLNLRPDGKIVVVGAKGTDSSAPAKTDRDLVLVQLTTGGVPDGTFGSAGVATSPTPGVNENPRQALVEASGKIVTAAYGTGIGGQTRPFITRFLPGGTPDPSFGSGGVATAEVGGPAPGFAEAYEVVAQGDNYVLTGYGSRSTTPETGIDAVLYRFTGSGQWDRSFGTDGLTTYNRVNGADRGRDLSVLKDGRLVVVGSTATAAATPDLDGLILVAHPNGALDTSVGVGGAIVVNLGGLNDAFFGSVAVANGTKIVAAGYLGGASAAGDDSAVVRAELSPEVAGPSGPAGPAGPPAPAPLIAPAPKPVAKTPTTAPKPAVSTLVRGGKLYLRVAVTVPKRLAGRTLVVQRKVGTKTLTLRSIKVPSSGKISSLVALRPGSAGGAAGVKGASRITVRTTIAGTTTAKAASSPFRPVAVKALGK